MKNIKITTYADIKCPFCGKTSRILYDITKSEELEQCIFICACDELRDRLKIIDVSEWV